MEYNNPKPCNLAKEEIYQKAKDISKQYDFEIGGDLKPIVTEMGGEIEYEDIDYFLLDGSSSIFIERIGDFCIKIPQFTSPLRDRFTLAHELGHYVLHYLDQGRTDKMKVARRIKGTIGTEANYFAAEFLMPSDKFKEKWEEYQNESMLAGIFLMSKDAIRVRRKALGL
jgi:Zn-dependent peptidase ImmA (M78 family)